jgi:effector-binding domain-containing protein
MDNIGSTLDSLARWIEENGYEAVGLHREVYLDTSCEDQSGWVTEIQESITRS